MIKIAVFVGSLQQKSFNRMLAKNLELLKSDDVEFQYIDLQLPLFNQDLETNYPIEVQNQKDIVQAADGILFITPEYNRSIPGVLKNAIDWITRPYGTSAFDGKPAGIIGAGLHHVSGAIAQSDLRHITAFLNMKIMGQPEVHVAEANKHFNKEGAADKETKRRLQEYMITFEQWVKNQVR